MLGGFEAMLPIVNQLANKLKLNAQRQKSLKVTGTEVDNDIDRVKMRTEIANLYSRQFTMSEMKQIIDFYGTPIGKKLIQQSPDFYLERRLVWLKLKISNIC
ncbi:DUF2059 domain-containing protein [Vibrio chagasii]|nr:DUF2059 domain-containing protein [Vibrio chagasii]